MEHIVSRSWSTLIRPSFMYTSDVDDDANPTPSERVWQEADAVRTLLLPQSSPAAEVDDEEDEGASVFVDFVLDDFVIYSADGELKPLHHQSTRRGTDVLYAAGVLIGGGRRCRVHHMSFERLPIGNYGVAVDTVGDQIWVETHNNQGSSIFYRLGNPAPEYKRFWSPFRWNVDLSKHFVDFIHTAIESGRDVRLADFAASFAAFIRRVHESSHPPSAAFRAWRAAYGLGDDFRPAVVANRAFLFKESIGALAHVQTRVRQLSLWRCMLFQSDSPRYPTQLPLERPVGSTGEYPTIVTQYTFDCFRDMLFANLLKPVALSPATAELRRRQLGRWRMLNTPAPTPAKALGGGSSSPVVVGDVVSMQADEKSEWRDGGVWYMLVTGVRTTPGSRRRALEVLWMYKLDDTCCKGTRYPHRNELFLSDHCNCDDGQIWEEDVAARHTVHFGGSPAMHDDEAAGDDKCGGGAGATGSVSVNSTGGRVVTPARESRPWPPKRTPADEAAGFFCRQTYVHLQKRWITWDWAHMVCHHKRRTDLKAMNRLDLDHFEKGETVLVRLHNGDSLLQPCEIVGSSGGNEGSSEMTFRRLLRRRELQPKSDARINELVYSDRLVVRNASEIGGKCAVRVYAPGAEIPAPYDRNGVGNLFVLTHRLVETKTKTKTGQESRRALVVPLTSDGPPPPATLKQGFDPCVPLDRLRGLDLFCGGGNFGRGIEEGGAVKMRWANDYSSLAMHTYMANVIREDNGDDDGDDDDGDDDDHDYDNNDKVGRGGSGGRPAPSVSPFLGSIDDFMKLAAAGASSSRLPRPGEVDFISGGSPCPGFSRLTNDKTTTRQRKNQSLVAAFVSAVDLFRPAYGVLENVPSMISSRGSDRSVNVFGQLVASLLGMGYQTQYFVLEAWRHGSPQKRSRVFLVFAAPGFKLPHRPYPSHSHYAGNKSMSHGQLPNGLPIEERDFSLPAFPFVGAAAAVADLPPIGDGRPDGCPEFPDHRTSVTPTALGREQLRCIPLSPYGQTFSRALSAGLLSPRDREAYFPKEGMRVRTDNNSAWGRVDPRGPMETVTTSCRIADFKCGRILHWAEHRPLSVMEVRRAQGFRDHEVLLGTPAQQWRTVGNSVAREVSVALGLVIREAWVDTNLEGVMAEAEENKNEQVVREKKKMKKKNHNNNNNNNNNINNNKKEEVDKSRKITVEIRSSGSYDDMDCQDEVCIVVSGLSDIDDDENDEDNDSDGDDKEETEEKGTQEDWKDDQKVHDRPSIRVRYDGEQPGLDEDYPQDSEDDGTIFQNEDDEHDDLEHDPDYDLDNDLNLDPNYDLDDKLDDDLVQEDTDFDPDDCPGFYPDLEDVEEARLRLRSRKPGLGSASRSGLRAAEASRSTSASVPPTWRGSSTVEKGTPATSIVASEDAPSRAGDRGIKRGNVKMVAGRKKPRRE